MRNGGVSPAHFVLGFVCVSLLMSHDVHACSCGERSPELRELRGALTDGALPTDVALFVHPAQWEYARLLDGATGEVVPTTTRFLSLVGESAAVSAREEPDVPLVPGASYRLVTAWPNSDEELEFAFVAGDAPAVVPAVPELLSVDVTGFGRAMSLLSHFFQSSCGPTAPHGTAELTFTSAPGTITLLTDDDDLDAFDPDHSEGAILAASRGGRIQISNSMCDHWPDGELGATDVVRLGAIGPNGRFSGWSEPIELEVPAYPLLGCASFIVTQDDVDGRGLGAMALIAIACRRRRTHCP